ncbi:hypothetical protein DOTSEDRAFT_157328 [Dothistroma septosporum NZE10]|uniref:Uncharacterized protein n=1 Tax=Dothistroma septosporum (strain NZE10 / CBS 128990) TaxID=675120 RepID=N1PD76_DOTSN|nr:hypothetical protein DOTSEDRAFT_157328 [Dothistroma septosporum NZE10]
MPYRNIDSKCAHPLDAVAATCRKLRSEVNDRAISFLVQHKEITRFAALPKKKRDHTFNMLRGRRGLLSWAEKHCIFCGRKSDRSAILINGLRCCAKCDKAQWPGKITKTDAKEKFDLRDEHLLPHCPRGSSLAVQLEARFPNGVPRIHYGAYIQQGGVTVMFLKKDVDRLVQLHHGDLEAHLAKREARRDAQRRKRVERASAKMAPTVIDDSSSSER